jgi:uncharacterized Zn-finger protein
LSKLYKVNINSKKYKINFDIIEKFFFARWKSQANKMSSEELAKKRTHNCHKCTKEYNKTSHLRAHLRAHDNYRPYVCDFKSCGKSFTRSDELKRHKRIHNDDRNFECRICKKKFLRSDHLNKHLLVHNKPAAVAAAAAAAASNANTTATSLTTNNNSLQLETTNDTADFDRGSGNCTVSLASRSDIIQSAHNTGDVDDNDDDDVEDEDGDDTDENNIPDDENDDGDDNEADDLKRDVKMTNKLNSINNKLLNNQLDGNNG